MSELSTVVEPPTISSAPIVPNEIKYRRALIWFALGAVATLCASAYRLWFLIALQSAVRAYGWGHVPREAIPQTTESYEWLYLGLMLLGNVIWSVAFMVAMASARKTAELLGISGYRWSLQWTLASLFIPGANFVRPWLGFAEIRRSIIGSARRMRVGTDWLTQGFSVSTLLLAASIFARPILRQMAGSAIDSPISAYTTVDAYFANAISFGALMVAADVVCLAYAAWYLISLRQFLGAITARATAPIIPRDDATRDAAEEPQSVSLSPAALDAIDASLAARVPRQLIDDPLPAIGPETQRSAESEWQTWLDYNPAVQQAVRRLGALTPRNVEEFRKLMLTYRDPQRIQEFENESIRLVQGEEFADESLRNAYVMLNEKDRRLGEELVRVVRVIGRPEDIDALVARITEKISVERTGVAPPHPPSEHKQVHEPNILFTVPGATAAPSPSSDHSERQAPHSSSLAPEAAQSRGAVIAALTLALIVCVWLVVEISHSSTSLLKNSEHVPVQSNDRRDMSSAAALQNSERVIPAQNYADRVASLKSEIRSGAISKIGINQVILSGNTAVLRPFDATPLGGAIANALEKNQTWWVGALYTSTADISIAMNNATESVIHGVVFRLNDENCDAKGASTEVAVAFDQAVLPGKRVVFQTRMPVGEQSELRKHRHVCGEIISAW